MNYFMKLYSLNEYIECILFHSYAYSCDYTLNRDTLKTFINYLTGEKQPIIFELWAAYGYYFFSLPMQDPYILLILQSAQVQLVSRLQLLLSNTHHFLRSSYRSSATYTELCMGSVMSGVCVLLFRV